MKLSRAVSWFIFALLFIGCYTLPSYQSVTVEGEGEKYYILNDSIPSNQHYPVVFFISGSEKSSPVWIQRYVLGARIGPALVYKNMGFLDFHYLTVFPEKQNLAEGTSPDTNPSLAFNIDCCID